MFDAALLNDKALLRELDGLPEKLQTKALRQALRDKGKEILQDARGNAREITPRLARSIKLRTLKSKTRGNIGVAIMTGTREELGISPSDRYYWPAAIELGTKHIRPRVFMRRALAKHKPTTLNDIARFMRARVEGVVAKEIARSLSRNA